MARVRKDSARSLWASIPLVVKEVGGLLVAVATLLAGLDAVGVIGRDDDDGPTPSTIAATGTAATAATPIVVRFAADDRDYSERGFFTPAGYVVSTQYSRLADRVVWTADGRRQAAAISLVEQGRAEAPGAVLFELLDEEGPKVAFGVRNAQRLNIGEAVTAFLGGEQRTPGKVSALHATVPIDGYGELEDLVVSTGVGRPSEGGAPLLDGAGRVVAMVFAGSAETTLSIPIERVRAEFPEAF